MSLLPSRGIPSRTFVTTLALLALVLAWPACDNEQVTLDAGADLGVDVGAEAGADSGPDVSAPDAASDGAPEDSAPDAAGDLGLAEAGADATSEAGTADAATPTGKPIWLVHITDTHIGASTFASKVLTEMLGEVVPVIAPITTVVTGDITEAGTAAQFTSYESIVKKGKVPAFPAYMEIPGNHDMKTGKGSEFIAKSQTGKAKGGLYGVSDLAGPGGKVRVVRTNTADSGKASEQLFGYFSSKQKTALLALPPPTSKLLHTVVAGHHPVAGLFGLPVLGTDKQMKELLTKVGAEVYLCGHVHSLHVSWLNKKTLVLQTPTLGKPSILNPAPAYMLVGLDTTGPSARLVPVGNFTSLKITWPVVLITTPAQLDLGGANPLAKALPAGKAAAVRALAFSPKGVTAVEVRVDGGAWASMVSAGKPLWQATVTAPSKAGKPTLEVRATSPEGTDTHKLKILVGP